MRLKRLSLHGFKSFGLPTELHFLPGLTAIVGPNGSGKSNLAEAVRWVLGEQSLRSLRGRKTEDVIFAGGGRRAPGGFAEVSLTFDNSAAWLPIAASEVALARRAYPTGENEYYLGGERVRLRDVQQFLARSGVSSDGYVVIGQGHVDAVLSLRPEERRAVFEDAATVGHLSTQIAETRQRLFETDQNLQRVCDLLAELEPRAVALAQQANYARERARLTAELHGALLQHFGVRWRSLAAERRRTEERLQATAAALRQATETADVSADELRRAREALHAVQGELTAVRRDQAGLQQEAAAAMARAEKCRRDHLDALATLNQTRLERQERERRREEAVGRAERTRADLVAAERRSSAIAAELDDLNAQGEAVLRRRQQLERDLDRARQEASRHQRALAAAEERARLRGERRSAIVEQIRDLEERAAAVTARLESAAARVESLEAVSQELHAAQAERDRRRQDLDRELADRRSELQQLIADEGAIDRQLTSCRDRLALLESTQDQHGIPPAVRAVLRAARNSEGGVARRGEEAATLHGVVGPVVRLIEVPTGLETAIEVALGGRLYDVVVERWSDAEAAVAFLRRSGAGRATFLPLDTLRAGPGHRGGAPGRGKPGVHGVAADLVRADPRFDKVVRYVLGATLVVEDLATARQVIGECPGGWQIVTISGEVVRSSGAITGGSAAPQRGMLARERERRSLPSEIARLTENRNAKRSTIEAVSARIEWLRREIASLEASAREVTARQRGVERELSGALRDRARIEEERRWQGEQLARLRRDLAASDEAADDDVGPIAEALNDARRRAEEATAALTTLEEAGGATLRRLAELRAERTHAERDVERLTRELAQLREETDRSGAEIDDLRNRERELERQVEEAGRVADAATEAVQVVHRRVTELADRQRALDDRYAARESDLRRSEQVERAAQERRVVAEREAQQAVVDRQRVESQIDQLKHQIAVELGPVEEQDDEIVILLPEGSRTLSLASAEVAGDGRGRGLQRQIDDLRQRLRRIPLVDVGVIEEHESTEARCAFLRSQLADLQSAADDLREAIADLEARTRQQFRESFAAVADAFGRRFTRLFGGGSAQLILLEGDSLDQIGIEIVAQPPGKRARGLALLSGGERALTAVALLLALLEVNPTPFCVLDEVDAALDDANVGRFCDALAELSDRTQFVVITHNRRTMEAADTLYGVAMEDRAISRVVSLRLSDITTTNGHVTGFDGSAASRK